MGKRSKISVAEEKERMLRAQAHIVYPFFLLHMLVFGSLGLFFAYGQKGPDLGGLYLFSALAISIYLVFYTAMFGRDEMKWLVINSCLGFYGLYAQLDWILSLFGRTVADFPAHVHVVPFIYYILYTFLIRRAALHFLNREGDECRRKIIEGLYVMISIVLYTLLYLL